MACLEQNLEHHVTNGVQCYLQPAPGLDPSVDVLAIALVLICHFVVLGYSHVHILQCPLVPMCL